MTTIGKAAQAEGTTRVKAPRLKEAWQSRSQGTASERSRVRGPWPSTSWEVEPDQAGP